MSLEVHWRGICIAKPEGPWRRTREFVPTRIPMPVGTELVVMFEDQTMIARVVEITEGEEAGMWLFSEQVFPAKEPKEPTKPSVPEMKTAERRRIGQDRRAKGKRRKK